ncbi:RNA polymerase II C-terminal domain phosphatase-like [Melia azedarach]|uniref:RNA polymerase II C-terminal domain phosphatase-like n=1 Tax=Melia azedarach TaxID=155640 RepID=A0ACC1XDM7_MELAZ|nr:RNA polymerase II C-terminal domain phosphatase-like [Melia azedarach]
MHLTQEEDYLKSQTNSLQDVSKRNIFVLDFLCMMTKLRPYVCTFLEEASQMFEIDHKGLDVVLGQESAVLILDDTESVWAKHKDNLILMERYHFFASSCRQFGYNCKSLSELKSDESEPDAALASVPKVLKRIHHMFFDGCWDDLGARDVRHLLKIVRSEVLKGCKIVFTVVIPTNFLANNHHLWKMAEQLGATCVKELDISVTHVVSKNVGTEKSRWAVKEKKFLVHPQWIEAANFLWQKQPEENFSISHTKDQR